MLHLLLAEQQSARRASETSVNTPFSTSTPVSDGIGWFGSLAVSACQSDIMSYPTYATSLDGDTHFVAPADLQLMPEAQGTSTGSVQQHGVDTLGDHVLDALPCTTENAQYAAFSTDILPRNVTVHAEA